MASLVKQYNYLFAILLSLLSNITYATPVRRPTATDPSCCLQYHVYRNLASGLSGSLIHSVTDFVTDYESSQNGALQAYTVGGCSAGGRLRNQELQRTSLDKLTLMHTELDNMSWWCQKILDDVSGTDLESSARRLLARYDQAVESLVPELTRMQNLPECTNTIPSFWHRYSMCMDFQVDQPSNPNPNKLIHAMKRMEDILVIVRAIQPCELIE